uniref:Uncharacterized protein n=1 Tax=Timema poppense TaxID=170557 RepID=A0A7R9D804_TIMPO|nr:unnamed protein product [Timema poppensis]
MFGICNIFSAFMVVVTWKHFLPHISWFCLLKANAVQFFFRGKYLRYHWKSSHGPPDHYSRALNTKPRGRSFLHILGGGLGGGERSEEYVLIAVKRQLFVPPSPPSFTIFTPSLRTNHVFLRLNVTTWTGKKKNPRTTRLLTLCKIFRRHGSIRRHNLPLRGQGHRLVTVLAKSNQRLG